MNIDKEGNFCYIPRNIIEDDNTSIEDCLMEVITELYERNKSRLSIVTIVLKCLDRFLDSSKGD
jgi:hypothetical protein